MNKICTSNVIISGEEKDIMTFLKDFYDNVDNKFSMRKISALRVKTLVWYYSILNLIKDIRDSDTYEEAVSSYDGKSVTINCIIYRYPNFSFYREISKYYNLNFKISIVNIDSGYAEYTEAENGEFKNDIYIEVSSNKTAIELFDFCINKKLYTLDEVIELLEKEDPYEIIGYYENKLLDSNIIDISNDLNNSKIRKVEET